MQFERKRTQQAYDTLVEIGDEYGIQDMQVSVDHLVRRVIEETEDAHLKGRVRHLGRPYMLYRLLEETVGQERRPVHRQARVLQIQKALDEFLGLQWNPEVPGQRPAKRKRKRRRLLTR